MSIAILDTLAARLRSDEQVIQIFETRTALAGYPDKELSDWAKGDVIAITLGGSSKFDGTYDIWGWDPTSTAAASASVVRPSAWQELPPPAAPGTYLAGRWISMMCECGGRGEIIG